MRSKRTLVGRKINNKGMSLVEVIIAITILGIVAVPVLHSMTTSMVYNAKARNRQEMTLTAESIMETFKGYDLDELKTRFHPSTGTGIEGVAVAPSGGFQYTYSSAPNVETVGDTYTFEIKDMEADNGQLYDVKITAEPNGVVKIMEPENMEATRDAVFKGNSSYDSEAHDKAVNDFLDKYTNDLVSAFSTDADNKGYNGAYVELAGQKEEITADQIDKMNIGSYIQVDGKKLTFTVSHDSSDDTHVVTAKLQYTYHFGKYPYYVKKEISSKPKDEYEEEGGSAVPVGQTEQWESEELEWYNGSHALTVAVDMNDTEENIYKNLKAAELERLFVYYYPNYSFSDGSDQIYIDNKTDRNIQCYIIKQRTQSLSATNLKTKENGYKGNVTVSNSGGGSCVVFHNFKDNIGGGSSTAAYSISGAVTDAYSIADSSGATPEIVTQFEQTEALSYKLTLAITQGDGADLRTITQIESTMNEKIKKKER